MNSKSLLLRFHNTLQSSAPLSESYYKRSHMWVPVKHKSLQPGRPKKMIYHRVNELDEAMDLRKRPNAILRLKSIIQSQKTKSLRLRDLEKEVGFVQKWNFIALIEKNPSIFHVVGGGGYKGPPFVRLTEKAEEIAREESNALELMEPILVKNLRKLLMLSVDCRVPLEKIKLIESELGLPRDFEKILIPKYPEFFSVKDLSGKPCLHLEIWDPSLAITAREESLARRGILASRGNPPGAKILRDGNFPGPHAFEMNFPAAFRPNTKFLYYFRKWQKLEFPSPYLCARKFDIGDQSSRKRVVGVIHELLSLTMEKRLTSDQVEAFQSEYFLPGKLLYCLIKHQGIFYITNKGAKSTVLLKEAYDGSRLKHKCPILLFNDKFVALSRTRVQISSF